MKGMRTAKLLCFIIMSLIGVIPMCAENLFRKGTEWICRGRLNADPRVTYQSRYYFQDDVTIEGKRYQQMRKETMIADKIYDNEVGAFRADGEKIYCIPKGANQEVLAYDFGLKPGEETIMYTLIYPYERGTLPEAEIVKLIEINPQTAVAAPTLSRMKLSEKGEHIFNEYIEWFSGIGSILGPEYNLYSGIAGFNSCLAEVWVNGVQIYKFEVSGIDSIEEAEITPVIYYNLNGSSVSNPSPGELVIEKKGSTSRLLLK